MCRIVAVLALLVAPPVCVGQGPPGTNLLVHVRVTSISIARDVTRIGYVLRNDARSRERLFHFMVEVPGAYSEIKSISRPQPPQSWTTTQKFGERSVAGWGVLGTQMAPGEQSPELTFEAVGLPTIVTSWIEGYTPPSTDIPSDTLPLPDARGVLDSTVGVEYDAVFRNAEYLLIRLRRLVSQACGESLGWITQASVCESLDGALAGASQRLKAADTPGARSQIRRFLTQLEGQHGAGLPINDSAYWLLKANAGFILKQSF